MDVYQDSDELALLLIRFNQRDTSAFAEVYTKFFVELHAYASRLYADTAISSEDVVQDVFCYLWERENVVFDSFSKVKAFLFVVIKNQYKKYVTHLGVEQKYKDLVERDTRFSEDIMESELCGMLLECVEQISDPGGQVMKLYLNGYDANEIAEKLKMSIRTVYNIKSQTVGILRKIFFSR